MKRLTILLLLVVTVMTTEAQNLKSIFDKHIGEGNYTVVTINGSIFQLAAEYANEKDEDFPRGVEGIQIFSAEEHGNKKARAALMEDVWAYFKNPVYKEFMRVEEKNERVVFYLRKASQKINELILVVEEDASVIQISGDIDLNEISKISKTMNMKGMEKLEEVDE